MTKSPKKWHRHFLLEEFRERRRKRKRRTGEMRGRWLQALWPQLCQVPWEMWGNWRVFVRNLGGSLQPCDAWPPVPGWRGWALSSVSWGTTQYVLICYFRKKRLLVGRRVKQHARKINQETLAVVLFSFSTPPPVPPLWAIQIYLISKVCVALKWGWEGAELHSQ